jgi:hypothetical protein
MEKTSVSNAVYNHCQKQASKIPGAERFMQIGRAAQGTTIGFEGKALSESSTTLLRRCTEEELMSAEAVSEKQTLKRWPPAGLGLATESGKVTCRFLPSQAAFRAAYTTQNVKPPQHGMSTAKPSQNHRQPIGNQPRSHHAFRVHLQHGAKEALLPHLPTLKTHKQGPNDRSHRVLKIGNQLYRQQRKGQTLSAAQKTRNGNPPLLEPWKQINRIPPIGTNLPITAYLSTDGASRSKVGVKINPPG